MQKIKIKKNKHRPGLPGLRLFRRLESLTMHVNFTDGARYDDPAEPKHVQKLYGFTLGILHGGLIRKTFLRQWENSVRWGWYWDRGPWLVPYIRERGEIVRGEPFPALANTTFSLRIRIEPSELKGHRTAIFSILAPSGVQVYKHTKTIPNGLGGLYVALGAYFSLGKAGAPEDVWYYGYRPRAFTEKRPRKKGLYRPHLEQRR